LHHLHPGHDDELSRLKARIAELEARNHELEEERRWRKCSEDMPSADEGYYGLKDLLKITPTHYCHIDSAASAISSWVSKGVIEKFWK
jgi:hypothetical protein